MTPASLQFLFHFHYIAVGLSFQWISILVNGVWNKMPFSHQDSFSGVILLPLLDDVSLPSWAQFSIHFSHLSDVSLWLIYCLRLSKSFLVSLHKWKSFYIGLYFLLQARRRQISSILPFIRFASLLTLSASPPRLFQLFCFPVVSLRETIENSDAAQTPSPQNNQKSMCGNIWDCHT